jgi:serine/threonine protein kinase
VRPDGTVKVLDFGIAKAMEPVGRAPNVSRSPTITTPAMTQAGMILGTAAYMSPEQARGKTVDKRTDIWAFGCVLYEMLTGTRAFTGDDVADVLASVLAKEPDWTQLPFHLSPALSMYIRRCLERDPKQRIVCNVIWRSRPMVRAWFTSAMAEHSCWFASWTASTQWPCSPAYRADRLSHPTANGPLLRMRAY